MPRVVREVPPEHDMRQVLECDGDLPLVVRARRHRALAGHALGALDELLVGFPPRLQRCPPDALARRREVVAAIPRHGRHGLLRPLVSPPSRDRAPARVDVPQRRLRPPLLVRFALVEVHLLGVEVGADVDREVLDVTPLALARHHPPEPRRQVVLRVRIRLHEHGDVRQVVVVIDDELQVHAALVPVVGDVPGVLGSPSLVHGRHRVPPRARRIGKLPRVLRVVRPHGHLGQRVPLVVVRHHHRHGRAPRRPRVVLGLQGDKLAAERSRFGGVRLGETRIGKIGGRVGLGGLVLAERCRRRHDGRDESLHGAPVV